MAAYIMRSTLHDGGKQPQDGGWLLLAGILAFAAACGLLWLAFGK